LNNKGMEVFFKSDNNGRSEVNGKIEQKSRGLRGFSVHSLFPQVIRATLVSQQAPLSYHLTCMD
jgi:hypothetical protein